MQNNTQPHASSTFELELHDTATDGRGVGRLANGKVVFVEGALGGEVITATLIQESSTMAEAQVASVLKKSDMRQKPPCRHAAHCGGCQLQHVTPAGQLALKKQWLIQTLRRIGQWPAEHIQNAGRMLRCEQATTSRYRQRVRWHFDGKELGFFARRTHSVTSAEGCLIAAPQFERARAELHARLTSPEFQQLFAAAQLVDLQIEATLLTNEAVTLWLKDSRCAGGNMAEAKMREAMHAFVKQWNGVQIDAKGFIPVAHPELPNFVISPQGFLQPHRNAMDNYRSEITRQLKSLIKLPALQKLSDKRSWTAWDLYCGAGAFSDLPAKAAGNSRHVTTWCVEGVSAAINALKWNHPSLAGQATVEDVREFIAARVRANELPDLLLCDPPRDGIGAPTARALATALTKKKTPSVVVWIACDMASFARDTKPFLDASFNMHSVALFDCFAHTMHAEIISIFWYAGAQP
ncbi:MAG: class I SAM-dependent RNA methyltransferase [Proteobacteria bacterium]|nr:class I SAM-dependent RNA methyltransferase [Pseudomonadota bacterium]